MICIFTQCIPLFAQETHVQIENIDEKSMKQKISWEGDENAFEYKVEVFSKQTEKSTFYTTSQTFIEFSLPPGEYKFKVITYDFFGREALESKWQDFTIAKALQPKIDQVEEQVTTKKKGTIEIPVELQDVPEDAKIVLINTKTNKEVEANLIQVEEETEEGKKVVTKLVAPALKEGDYKISVTNPGGKTTVSDSIKFKKEEIDYKYKNINIQAGAGLDFWFIDTNWADKIDTMTFGPSVKISWLPFRVDNNYFGFELYSKFSKLQLENQYVSMNLELLMVNLNLMYEYNLYNDRILLEVKAGAGVTIVNQEVYVYLSTNQQRQLGYSSFDAAFYVLFKPLTYMNINIGVEYSGIFTGDDYLSFIAPAVNMGISF